jgi:hypothetical protein
MSDDPIFPIAHRSDSSFLFVLWSLNWGVFAPRNSKNLVISAPPRNPRKSDRRCSPSPTNWAYNVAWGTAVGGPWRTFGLNRMRWGTFVPCRSSRLAVQVTGRLLGEDRWFDACCFFESSRMVPWICTSIRSFLLSFWINLHFLVISRMLFCLFASSNLPYLIQS